MLITIICCIFLSVALFSGLGLYSLLPKKDEVLERLGKMLPEKAVPATVTLTEVKPWWKITIENLGAQMPVAPREHSKYTKMLEAAGLRSESLYLFIGSKLALALILPALFVFFYAVPRGVLMETQSLLYITALVIIGFLLPSVWLTYKVKNRKIEIFHTLPDILDLLTVCVEAGLGIDAALNRTCDTPQFEGNPLAEELKTAARQIRAGKPRSDALNDMAERTMVDDIEAFVTMLVQTERFGTSLSLALRVHSDSLRTKRRQIAEEKAAKTAVKILFPLLFFIFPALMIVLIGPAFFKLTDIFK
jgi:tight adherence protein C